MNKLKVFSGPETPIAARIVHVSVTGSPPVAHDSGRPAASLARGGAADWAGPPPVLRTPSANSLHPRACIVR